MAKNKATNNKSSLKSRFVLFCDYALISQDGKLSIIGEFNRVLGINQKPILRGFLVGSFQGDPNEQIELVIQFVNSKNVDLLPVQKLSVVSGDLGIVNTLLRIDGLMLPEAGTYRARFSHNDQLVAEVELVTREETVAPRQES